MNESTFAKVIASLSVAFPLYWARIPDPVGALCGLILADILLGGIYYWVDKNKKFDPWDMSKRFFQKFMLTMLLLWAAQLAQSQLGPILSFDIVIYVTRVLIVFEFISCIGNYSNAGGPGHVVIGKMGDRMKLLFDGVPTTDLDQEAVATKLEAERLTGQKSRL